jgi:hypothetical protein
VVRCCEASPERHRKPSSAAAKALGEVQSESPGRHGGGGCGRRGVLEMSGLKERSGFLRLLQKTTVCRRNFASLPRQARERPGQIWLRELLSRGAAAILPGSSSWHLEIRRLRLALACALIPALFPVQSSKSDLHDSGASTTAPKPEMLSIVQQLSELATVQEMAINAEETGYTARC